MDFDLHNLDYQDFEDLCTNLLKRESSGVRSIDGSGGDKGVDCFKGQLTDEVTIYQHKFYTERLKSSDKTKIEESYTTAKVEHPDMEQWVLLIPLELTHKEHEWFEEAIENRDDDIDVEIWQKNEIEDRLSKYSTLVDRYFPRSIYAASQIAKDALEFLTGSPVERAWLTGKKLDEIKEENPHLGIDYEFSSDENTRRIKLDPESGVRINTRLQAEQEKLEKIKSGEEVRFSQGEVDDIEFEPDLLIGDEFEFSEFKLKPSYHDWEQDMQIEIPGSSLRKEMTVMVEDVSESTVLLKSKDSLFGLEIELDMEKEEIEINITGDFENEPVFRISEFLDFTDQIKEHGQLQIRELDDGNSILKGEIEIIESPEEMNYFRELINDLVLIESHTGKSFTFTDDFDDIDELHTIIASGLITEGESTCSLSISGDIIEGMEENILQLHEENEFTQVRSDIKDFGVTILNQHVKLGDVRLKYPNPDLANANEIRRKIDQPEPTPFELQPSENAKIERLE